MSHVPIRPADERGLQVAPHGTKEVSMQVAELSRHERSPGKVRCIRTIVGWDYDQRDRLTLRVVDKPTHHRVFITKGQYNKLVRKHLDLLET